MVRLQRAKLASNAINTVIIFAEKYEAVVEKEAQNLLPCDRVFSAIFLL
jgi:hypothetical protein